MFTGIVEAIGIIKNIVSDKDCVQLTITPDLPLLDVIVGDSVSVNGVCLTVTALTTHELHMTVVPETLRLTNLDLLSVGSPVNLERSLKANGRMGGHFVQGHVDGVGKIISLVSDGKAALQVKIQLNTQLNRYIVNKGYITLDGMSITVIEAKEDWFTATLIPHTQAVTVVKHYGVGTEINIEVDILGKYVEKLLSRQSHPASENWQDAPSSINS
jgi:riboflavin synthase